MILWGFDCYTQSQLLRYDEPASLWTEALPIGNSFMGGMVFGGTQLEHIQLNESTLYSGDPNRSFSAINVRRHYKEILDLVEKGDYAKAQSRIGEEWLGRNQECYQPMSDLWMEFEHEEIEAYERKLDLENALVTVDYKSEGTEFHREIFASYPDHVIVIRLTSDGPATINGRVWLDTPHKSESQINGQEARLDLQGQGPGFVMRRSLEQVEKAGDERKYPEIFNKDGSRKSFARQVLYGDDIDGMGMYFQTSIVVKEVEGTVYESNGSLFLKDVKSLVLVLSAATSYNGPDKSPALEGKDPSLLVDQYLSGAKDFRFNDLRRRHVQDYHELFNRVSLKIGEQGPQSQLTTDDRILQFSNGKDPSLAALFFQYGRYLMISGSRKGGQPLNLQGIWNKDIIPPWASAYTMNINLEMNYWPAEVTNLSECHEPFFTAVKELAKKGTTTAWRMYGNRGWVAHHNMSIWRQAEPVDLCPCSFWPMGAGWLVSHFWEHYLFSGDKSFLRSDVFPLIKGAALFYSDWLVENENGKLVTPVGHSPEQTFKYGTDEESTMSPGPTMDIALIRETFTRYIEASQILEIEDPFVDLISSQLERLLPYQIGAYGQLQEWQYDFADKDIHHRHISHLYPFHPGNQINPFSNEELSRSVKRVLDRRGDLATGWSMGWKINVWARLLNGEKSLEILNNLIRLVREDDPSSSGGGSYPNMFDAHPPFQIDGNFGAAAGIAEMLLQSHADAVHLLPALPPTWKSGHIKGLRARGGFEVEIDWEDEKIATAQIISHLGGPLRIRSNQRLTFNAKEHESIPENHFMKGMDPGAFENHANEDLPELDRHPIYEYKIMTSVDQILEIVGH